VRRRHALTLLCAATGAACSPGVTSPSSTVVPRPTIGLSAAPTATAPPTGIPATVATVAPKPTSVPTVAPTLTPVPTSSATPAATPVLAGIDVLMRDRLELLRGRRLGLVTNPTGRARDGRSTIDVLHADASWRLVALFSPEHGIRGEAEAGQSVDSSVDQQTGLPIYSLYGDTTRPTDAMLSGVETLVYDIQDVGTRTYTYISTLLEVMHACAQRGLPVVVLDRPNPIGGDQVEGNVLDPRFASFVGPAPIAMRYGLTIGELGQFFNAELGVGADLTVVPLQGWRRSMWFDQTGLSWVNPSPNIRSVTAAALYPGMVLVEGTNLSEGRGTARPFEWVGAPWLDSQALADALNARGLPGVRFSSSDLTPDSSKFAGQVCHGVATSVTERVELRPMELGVSLIAAAMHVAGGRVQLTTDAFDRLAGTDQLRKALETARPVEEIVAAWQPELDQFRARRDKYLLYPESPA
jgi:uncharacterized protein YbbC (DUF1343 family)